MPSFRNVAPRILRCFTNTINAGVGRCSVWKPRWHLQSWKSPGHGLPAASWIPQEPKASAYSKVRHPHLWVTSHKPEFVQKGEERWQTLLTCIHVLSNLLAASGNYFIFTFNISMSSTNKPFYLFFFLNYSSLYRHLNALLYTCPPLNWGENQTPAQHLYVFCMSYSISVMFYTQLFIFSSSLRILTRWYCYISISRIRSHLCLCFNAKRKSTFQNSLHKQYTT